MVGTIMEKSATPLKLWFYAMYLMASTRCGISAKQLERELGVTYKTAWRIFKQIRSMLTDNVVLEGSSVEADETYIGGRRHGKRGRGAEGKTPVFGIAQRQGKVIAKVVPDVQANTLLPIIKERVLQKSIVYTDELPSYDRLPALGYKHKRIHHASKVYVMGDIHTNTIDGFWSLVKRGISGVNHAVSAKYLPNYLNEYAFRYNRRDGEEPMFEAFLSQLVAVSERGV
jgi:transposase-like protein